MDKHSALKEMFRDLPLLFREKCSGTRQTIEKLIKRKKLSVVKKMELTSNEAVMQALLAVGGHGTDRDYVMIGNKQQNPTKTGQVCKNCRLLTKPSLAVKFFSLCADVREGMPLMPALYCSPEMKCTPAM